ncbi:MAG: hypothetical protein COY80_03965 [Candidatus Pacebacteria bacterium CG_4_10_14_0_8_um_filter_42_14]|nr:MAG: hypothetical protein COY80_03965 [Candidatus Pacebacteria bacterium CG_4_10_14_0_8_um_filter_42_14]
MTDTNLLIGSLSNDLFRVASLAQRGSNKAASRFLIEAKRWSKDLEGHQVADHISRLALDISSRDSEDISLSSAEQYLMYGVLLQNYALHNR